MLRGKYQNINDYKVFNFTLLKTKTSKWQMVNDVGQVCFLPFQLHMNQIISAQKCRKPRNIFTKIWKMASIDE